MIVYEEVTKNGSWWCCKMLYPHSLSFFTPADKHITTLGEQGVCTGDHKEQDKQGMGATQPNNSYANR